MLTLGTLAYCAMFVYIDDGGGRAGNATVLSLSVQRLAGTGTRGVLKYLAPNIG